MTVTTAAYVRLSRAFLPEQTSTKRQLGDCRKLADLRGWGDVVPYEDVDFSAYRKTHRPAYEQLLADVQAGLIERVVFWKLDRIARNLAEFLRFQAICEDHGVILASVNDPYDTSTPMGRAMVQIMAVFAELESGTISLRVKSARALEAANGQPHRGGYRRFGYTKDLELDDTEAAMVRRAAGLILAGGSVTRLAGEWNEAGLRSVGGKTWTPKMVSSMLRSPHLAGLRRHLGEIVAEGTWPPILDQDTHYALVAALDDLPGARTTRDRTYLLSGLLVCGRPGCGAALIAHPQRAGVRAYWCSNKPGAVGCGRLSALANPLEAYVRDVALGVIDRDVLAAALAPRPGPDADLEILAARLAKVEASKDLLDAEDYAVLSADLQARLNLARRNAARWRRPAVMNGPKAGQALEAWWDDPATTVADRHELLALVLDRVVLLPGVRGRKGFDPDRVPPDSFIWRV